MPAPSEPTYVPGHALVEGDRVVGTRLIVAGPASYAHNDVTKGTYTYPVHAVNECDGGTTNLGATLTYAGDSRVNVLRALVVGVAPRLDTRAPTAGQPDWLR